MKTNRVRRTSTAARPARQSQTAPQTKTPTNGAGRVRVDVPMPAEMAEALEDALKATGMDRDTFFHKAVSERIERENKQRATLVVPDMRYLSDVLYGLEEAEDTVRGLFYLLVSHLEKGNLGDIEGTAPNETEVCGIMKLGWLASGAISKHREDLRDLYEAIGGPEMVSEDAREKLAAMGIARDNVKRMKEIGERVANDQVPRASVRPLREGGAR